MRRYGRTVSAEFIAVGDRPTLADVTPIARVAIDAYIEERVDAVFLVYTRFINTLSLRPEFVQLSADRAARRAGRGTADGVHFRAERGSRAA